MKINQDLLLSFGKIVVNKDLPKYTELPKKKQEKKEVTEGGSTEEDDLLDAKYFADTGLSGTCIRLINAGEIKDYISKADARDFNIAISEALLNDIKKYLPSLSINVNARDSSALSDSEKEAEEEKMSQLDVSDIFNEVHIQVGKEREFVSRVRAYCELINKAHVMGQTAQEDILARGLIVHIYESVLAVTGFNKYIDLKNLQELQKKCVRLLDLDYIANFTRIISPEVAEKKLLADKLHVFDNYVVLHYDPTGASREMTEEEKMREIKRKADPVLFGVILGSTKLYYIGDWVDEYCDLTWEQIVEKIGESVLD